MADNASGSNMPKTNLLTVLIRTWLLQQEVLKHPNQNLSRKDMAYNARGSNTPKNHRSRTDMALTQVVVTDPNH